MIKDHEDAFGRSMYDYLHGLEVIEIIERDDGYITPGSGPALYFQEHADWLESEKKALTYAQGKVLDIGCGAGRHSLYLQELGYDVTGIDVSPMAVKTCQERGLRKAQVASITQVSRKMGTFDTILMMGNNFGLISSPQRGIWLMERFYGMTNPSARIIAQTRDVYQTEDPDHLAYHKQNRARSRMSGQIRLRVRYKKYQTPWFDLLFLSAAELQELLKPTKWLIKEILDDPSGNYVAIIEKKSANI